MSPCAHDSMEWAGVKGLLYPVLLQLGRAGVEPGFGLFLMDTREYSQYSASFLATALRPLYHGSMLGGAFWPTWRICVGPHHQHQRRTPTSPIPHLLVCLLSLSCVHPAAAGRMGTALPDGLSCRLPGRCLMGWLVRLRAGGDAASRHLGACELSTCELSTCERCAMRALHPQGPVRMLPKGAHATKPPKPPHTSVLCSHLWAGRLENGPIDKGQIAGTIAA